MQAHLVHENKETEFWGKNSVSEFALRGAYGEFVKSYSVTDRKLIEHLMLD